MHKRKKDQSRHAALAALGLALLLCASVSMGQASGAIPEIITTATLPQEMTLSPAITDALDEAKRFRFASIDIDALIAQLRASVVDNSAVGLKLFEDYQLSFTAQEITAHTIDEAFRDTEPDRTSAWTWRGIIPASTGGTDGYASVTIIEADGITRMNDTLEADIMAGVDAFKIEPIGMQVFAVYQVGEQGAAEDVVGTIPEPLRDAIPDVYVPQSHTPTTSDPTTIDVLVLVTQAARSYRGSNIYSWVAGQMGNANTTNSNSQVPFRFRLVGIRDVEFTETDLDGDLNKLTDGDGNLAPAHSWRDELGADLVSVVGRQWFEQSGNRFCGVAWEMDKDPARYGAAFASSAFSVVDAHNTCHNTLVHEMGHNISLRHAWGDTSEGGEAPAPYHHGYRDNLAGWRTMMAYHQPECAYPCSRILHWSNPDVFYLGRPTGVSGGSFPADNARGFKETGSFVVNFRIYQGRFGAAPYWSGADLARDLALVEHADTQGVSQPGAWMLDSRGGVHLIGGALPVSTDGGGLPYWNDSVARGIDTIFGTRALTMLDRSGGIHIRGTTQVDTTGLGLLYRSGQDSYRGVSLIRRPDGKYGGVLLDGNGVIYPWGGAIVNTFNSPSWSADIARNIYVFPEGTGGYVLDKLGGIHPFGNATPTFGGPYWTKDAARGIVVDQDRLTGYIVDLSGGIHSFRISPQ